MVKFHYLIKYGSKRKEASCVKQVGKSSPEEHSTCKRTQFKEKIKCFSLAEAFNRKQVGQEIPYTITSPYPWMIETTTCSSLFVHHIGHTGHGLPLNSFAGISIFLPLIYQFSISTFLFIFFCLFSNFPSFPSSLAKIYQFFIPTFLLSFFFFLQFSFFPLMCCPLFSIQFRP